MIDDAEADRLATIAVELVTRVRDYEPAVNAHWLIGVTRDKNDWLRLCFVLAAAVPTDQPWSRLTAWTRRGPGGVRPAPVDSWEEIEKRQEVLVSALATRRRRVEVGEGRPPQKALLPNRTTS